MSSSPVLGIIHCRYWTINVTSRSSFSLETLHCTRISALTVTFVLHLLLSSQTSQKANYIKWLVYLLIIKVKRFNCQVRLMLEACRVECRPDRSWCKNSVLLSISYYDYLQVKTFILPFLLHEAESVINRDQYRCIFIVLFIFKWFRDLIFRVLKLQPHIFFSIKSLCWGKINIVRNVTLYIETVA